MNLELTVDVEMGTIKSAEVLKNLMAEMMSDVDDIHIALRYGGVLAASCGSEHAIRCIGEGASVCLKSQGMEEEVSDMLACVSRARTAVYRLTAAVCRAADREAAEVEQGDEKSSRKYALLLVEDTMSKHDRENEARMHEEVA